MALSLDANISSEKFLSGFREKKHFRKKAPKVSCFGFFRLVVLTDQNHIFFFYYENLFKFSISDWAIEDLD